jgi:AraC-like DNA-binding protein
MTIEDSVFVYRLAGGDRTPGSDRLTWHGRYHAHSGTEYELHFFVDGSGSFLCNRTRYPVSGGQLFLSGPREFHSVVPDSAGHPLSYYAILFSLDESGSEDEIRLIAALRHCLTERKTVLTISANFRFQFEDLLQMDRSSEGALRESARHLLISFLFRWFGQYSPQPVPRNRAHVEKALALMEKSVRENIKVEDLAWKIGLSDEHFIRIFRAEVRMTPHQYFQRLKVEGACGLLMSTDKTVGEISDWFGFENQFHFSRIFKKCTGMPPLEYRRTYLQTVDFT